MILGAKLAWMRLDLMSCMTMWYSVKGPAVTQSRLKINYSNILKVFLIKVDETSA